jgi:hypothetical protein
MEYSKLKDVWTGLHHSSNVHITTKEPYSGPVTLTLNEWQEYVASGKNILYGSGGVIPGGTMSIPFGSGGSVYLGHVRQGIGNFL